MPTLSTEAAEATLGVSPTATDAEIRKAFRRKARHCHPDRAGVNATTAFQRLTAARDLLLSHRVPGSSPPAQCGGGPPGGGPPAPTCCAPPPSRSPRAGGLPPTPRSDPIWGCWRCKHCRKPCRLLLRDKTLCACGHLLGAHQPHAPDQPFQCTVAGCDCKGFAVSEVANCEVCGCPAKAHHCRLRIPGLMPCGQLQPSDITLPPINHKSCRANEGTNKPPEGLLCRVRPLRRPLRGEGVSLVTGRSVVWAGC